jgi:hypothetical protein
MTKPTQPKIILIYQDENGKEPFTAWFKGLRKGAY